MSTLPSRERMFVVLNDQHTPPHAFEDKTIRFGTPAVTDLHDRNTLVTVYGKPGHGYYGEVDLYYNRIDVQDLVYSYDFRTRDAITRETIVAAIANSTQEDISPADFIDFDEVVLVEGDFTNFDMTVDPSSLQWTGVLPVTVEHGWPSLEAAVGRKSIGVHTHPNANYRTRRWYGRLMGWDIDFTGVHLWMRPDRLNSNKMVNHEKMLQLTSALGWPRYYSESVQDLSTSAVPLSNPKYERVIVLNNHRNATISGPLYFHYNTVKGYL